MKKLLPIVFSLLVLSVLTASAQDFSISGKVFSKENNLPLASANIVLKGENNQIVAASTSGPKGDFSLAGIKPGNNYRFEISFVGFKTYQTELRNVSSDIKPGKIFLVEEAKNLEEVSLVAKEPLAVMKGDTLQYNSSAYKTNPDATAEDLAKKMPGIEISGNTVKAQGEDVKKVTVDGKPFFDQDASLTLKTLPASVVDKIEIFDEQSEQAKITGFDDGNTSKTMNIVTHTKMRNGTFGKFYGGYGPGGYYQAGATYNVFKGKRRISLLGMSNNINIRNFSPEDFLGNSGGGGMGGGRPSGGNNFSMGNQSGLSSTNGLGINYSDSWGSKITVTGSYFFNDTKQSDIEKLQQDYFSKDSTNRVYNESQVSSSENYNHRFNLRLEYKIDSFNTILFLPRLSLQTNNLTTGSVAQNLLNGILLNTSGSSLWSDRSGYNYSNDFLYSHSFAKKGRTLSFSLGLGLSNQKGDARQKSTTVNYGSTAFLDSIMNRTDDMSGSNSLSTRLSWTEPIWKRSSLIFNLGNSIRWNSSDKQTFDLDPTTSLYDQRDTSLSNVFESKYNSSSLGIGYRFGAKKLSLVSSLDYEYSRLIADEEFPRDINLDHAYLSLLPGAMLRYDFSKTVKLRMFYRTNTSSPTVSQLQDVPDNRNPLQISVGNSRLKPSYQQNIFMRFSKTNAETATTFFLLFGGGTSNNYVANDVFIAGSDTLLPGKILLARGARLTRPVNMNGSWNIRSFMNYGIPISAIKTNLNLNLSWTYNRIPGVLNGNEGFSDSQVAGLGIVLGSNISENVDFTISSNSSYNHTVSSLENGRDNDYFSQRTGLQANLIFWKSLVFNSDLSHQYYSGLSSQFSDNYLLWNLGLAKKVFKDQSGELKLSIYDVLKQNTSYNRTVTESYIQDSQNQVLGQYIMFTFTYKLKSFKEEGQENRRFMEPGMGPPPGEGPPPGNGPPPGGGPGMRPEMD